MLDINLQGWCQLENRLLHRVPQRVILQKMLKKKKTELLVSTFECDTFSQSRST